MMPAQLLQASPQHQQHNQSELENLTTKHLIDNMRTPNIFDIGALSTLQKTSKRVLN